MASPVMLSIDSRESRNEGYYWQPGIANHSISQFGIDQCIEAQYWLRVCLMSKETASQITFIGGPPMQLVIGKGLR